MTFKLDKLREKYLSNFYLFCRDVIGYEDLHEPLHGRICEFISEWSPDKFIKLVLVPRKHLKSSIGSIAYPIWLWAKNPNLRINLCHGKKNIGKEYLAEIKDKIENNVLLKTLFPDSFYSNPRHSGKWQSDQIDVKRKKKDKVPSMFVSSEDAGSTGFHYDFLIVDDIVHLDNYKTPELRHKTKEYFSSLLPQRDGNAPILILATRWHEDDVYGSLLDPEFTFHNNVECLKLDCGYPVQPIFPKKHPEAKAGFTLDGLQKIKDGMLEFDWSCHFMNDPRPRSQKYFLADDIGRFEFDPTDPRRPFGVRGFLKYYISVDPNRSLKKINDPCVVLVGCKDWSGRTYIVDMLRGHPTGPEMVQWIRSLVDKWDPDVVYFEDTGFQAQLGTWCQEDMVRWQRFYRTHPVHRETNANGKHLRITGIENYVKARQLWVAIGLDSVVAELDSYPGKHDDICDCLVDIIRLGSNPPPPEDTPTGAAALRYEQDWNLHQKNLSHRVRRVSHKGVRRVMR